jgi:hypothetical protein
LDDAPLNALSKFYQFIIDPSLIGGRKSFAHGIQTSEFSVLTRDRWIKRVFSVPGPHRIGNPCIDWMKDFQRLGGQKKALLDKNEQTAA